jgi:hypothetical protein
LEELMIKSLLSGGVLGGLVLFAWLAVSWAVLPFHRGALLELPRAVYDSSNQPDVVGPTQVVVAMQESGVSRHGIYYSGEPHAGSTGPEIPFMVWLPRGYPSQASVMSKGVLLSILAAIFVTFIVLSTRQQSYKARVALCTCIGAVVALTGPMTFGNFFFFPLEWQLPEIADQLIGWTLAGLVISAFTKPTATVEA